MKRILLAVTLITFSFSPVVAQEAAAAAAPQEQKVDMNLSFLSKTNEISAMISRKRTEDARKVYQDIAKLMQQSISENMKKMETAAEDEKSSIKQVVDQQNKLYGETKMLSVDLVKNHDQFVEKLQAFRATLNQ